jgi:ParB family transcriptional regulator, chromosome partitioning protein
MSGTHGNAMKEGDKRLVRHGGVAKTMRVVEIHVDNIKVGDRRRKDFGDIAALANGIQRVGLLEPIIVEEHGPEHLRLIAGDRRLRAVKMLGWKTISAHLRGEMTDEELRDIELEENENRKSLTDAERARTFKSSKKLVENKQKAAEVLARNGPKVSTGGRPADPTSTRAIADALGTSRQSIERAEQHVETAERFPFMQGAAWRQSHVLAVREKVAELPATEQEHAISVLGCAKVMDPALAVSLVEKLANKPEPERKQIYQLSQSEDPRERSLALTKTAELPPMPDPRLALLDTALGALRSATKPYPDDIWTSRLIAVAAELRSIRASIKDARNNTKGESIQ